MVCSFARLHHPLCNLLVRLVLGAGNDFGTAVLIERFLGKNLARQLYRRDEIGQIVGMGKVFWIEQRMVTWIRRLRKHSRTFS